MKRIFISFAILLVMVSMAGSATLKTAVDASNPEALIRSSIDLGLAVLSDPQLKGEANRKARRENIRQIMLNAADMPIIASLTLSKSKKRFSAAEITEFTNVFSQLLFSTYIGHVEKYSGETVTYGKTQKISDSKVTVPAKVATSEGVIPVDFSLFKKGSVWKIYDVKIEGVSLVRNYRQQFDEVLVKKSPSDLIQQLKQKVAKNESL